MLLEVLEVVLELLEVVLEVLEVLEVVLEVLEPSCLKTSAPATVHIPLCEGNWS